MGSSCLFSQSVLKSIKSLYVIGLEAKLNSLEYVIQSDYSSYRHTFLHHVYSVTVLKY